MEDEYISIKLKKATEELLNKARSKYIKSNPDKKPFDYRVIHEALGVYLNGK